MLKHNHILTRHEDERYRARRLHVLQTPGVAQLLILAFIAADAFTLYSVFDLMLTQQTWISKVITITLAAVINIAPMLLAAQLRNPDLTQRMRGILCGILIGLFLLLFFVTFLLRYASRAELFTSTAQLDSFFAERASDLQEKSEPTAAQNILAVILGLEPLATSVCSFVLGYEVSPKRKQEHISTIQAIELKELLDTYLVMAEELEMDIAFDLDGYDGQQYAHIQKLVYAMADMANTLARRKLSAAEAAPEAVSHLLEGGYRKEQSAESAILPATQSSIRHTASIA